MKVAWLLDSVCVRVLVCFVSLTLVLNINNKSDHTVPYPARPRNRFFKLNFKKQKTKKIKHYKGTSIH